MTDEEDQEITKIFGSSSPSEENGVITPEHVYENSGHRLLCWGCRDFQRASIDLVVADKVPFLRITCKTCKTSQEFDVRRDGSFMPKEFAVVFNRYAMRRARTFLRGVE